MKISDQNLSIWLWLCERGGKWTAKELAVHYGGNSQELFRSLHAMSRRQLVAKYPPEPGNNRNRYGVTGTCLVPYGVCVAQCQA